MQMTLVFLDDELLCTRVDETCIVSPFACRHGVCLACLFFASSRVLMGSATEQACKQVRFMALCTIIGFHVDWDVLVSGAGLR